MTRKTRTATPSKARAKAAPKMEIQEAADMEASVPVPAETNQGAVVALGDFDYGDDVQTGFSDADQSDVSIPYLKIMQGLSPEVEENENVKPGQIWIPHLETAVSGETGIRFIPCEMERWFVHWRTRKAGGGKLGQYRKDDDFVQRAFEGTPWGRAQLDETTELVETVYLYGIVIDDAGAYSPVVISLYSTAVKAWRDLNTKIQTFRPLHPVTKRTLRIPLTSQVFRLTTEKRKNDKGTFYVPVFARDGKFPACVLAPSDPIGQEAAKFAETLKELAKMGSITEANSATEDGVMGYDSETGEITD